MWSMFVTLIASLFEVFLKRKESTAETLGKAEQAKQDDDANVAVLRRMDRASANAPVTNEQMSALLDKGKLCVPLLCLLMASCAADCGIAYPCTPIRDWSVAEQQNAKADLETLPPDSAVWSMIKDYARIRAQDRACNG